VYVILIHKSHGRFN